MTRSTAFARSVIEGYRRGRKAAWLPGEDYEALLHEPLEAARKRLGIAEAPAYKAAQQWIAEFSAARAPVSTASDTAG